MNESSDPAHVIPGLYLSAGPQVVDDTLDPVHHLQPHSLLLRPRGDVRVEVSDLLVKPGRAHGRKTKPNKCTVRGEEYGVDKGNHCMDDIRGFFFHNGNCVLCFLA